MAERRWSVPNLITLGRIAVCPVLFAMVMAPGAGVRIAAFWVFIAAALSDVWDGYLARKHGWITDVGKLLDPLADKLLLAAVFIPFYLISQRPGVVDDVPFWGPLPLWVVVVIFGRELFITLFRAWAAGRGVVIAAGRAGKHKALVQHLFNGGFVLWLPLATLAAERGWSGWAWATWSMFHRAWCGITLAFALYLTVYSLFDYLWRYRSLLGLRV